MSEPPVVTTGTRSEDDDDDVTYEYASVGENPEWGKPDADGFVGVNPEYANFANDTDQPLHSDEEMPDGEPETAFQMAQVEAHSDNSGDEESSSAAPPRGSSLQSQVDKSNE